MINDIGEVGHGFMAFVHGGREDFVTGSHSLGGINGIDSPLPTIVGQPN